MHSLDSSSIILYNPHKIKHTYQIYLYESLINKTTYLLPQLNLHYTSEQFIDRGTKANTPLPLKNAHASTIFFPSSIHTIEYQMPLKYASRMQMTYSLYIHKSHIHKCTFCLLNPCKRVI